MSGSRRFPSPSATLKRVVGAWAVILTIWLSQTGLAWLLAGPTRGAAKAAARDFGYVEDGHLLFSIIELIEGTPAIAAALFGGVIASAVLGFLMWLIFAGAAFGGLRGKTSVGRAIGGGIEAAPRVAVQGLYVTLLRALLIAPSFLPGVAGKIGGAVGALLVLVTIPAFDRVRAAVTAPDAERAMHPKQLLTALRESVTRPLISIPAVLLWAASLAYLVTMMTFVLSAPQEASTIWVARAGSLFPVLLGFVRFALVVQADATRDNAESNEAAAAAQAAA